MKLQLRRAVFKYLMFWMFVVAILFAKYYFSETFSFYKPEIQREWKGKVKPFFVSDFPACTTNGTKLQVSINSASTNCLKQDDVIDKIRLNRYISFLEESDIHTVLFRSSLQLNGSPKVVKRIPGDVPHVAHFVWCGFKMYRYEDHLGVMSIIKIWFPQKLIFHYQHFPSDFGNHYHTWFQELKQSVPNVVFRHTKVSLTCNTDMPLMFGLEQLAATDGGAVLFGERTVLTHVPDIFRSQAMAAYFTNPTETKMSRGYVISTKGSIAQMNVYMSDFKKYIMNNSSNTCLDVKQFNQKIDGLSSSSSSINDIPPCILAPENLYPKDIINTTSPFSTVARWIYYGQGDRIEPKPIQNKSLIPNITHYLALANTGQTIEWSFTNYLSVLSALYLAKFERVYIHATVEPIGEWWTKTKTESRVTFVKIDTPETVFQQSVNVLPHASDILRVYVLLKYGGTYQDWNVIWVNPPPESNRHYEAVITLDWPDWGIWPETVNLGVMMAREGANFLKLLAESFSAYLDHSWGFNAIMMPYKIYERNPESVYLDRKLQVICYYGICHPAWEEGYVRRIGDTRPTMKFNLSEISAFHFTVPKFPPSLSNYSSIRNGNDDFAKIGRQIFHFSGRDRELNGE